VASQLWLLRHGEAVPHDATADDADRPLTPRGEEQSRTAGEALKALEVQFHAVYTSPKVRARDTARLACEALGCEPIVHEPLREGFDAGDARELMLSVGDEQRVLVVGHNPDFPQVIHDVTGARVELKKGGIAAIRDGQLIALLRPRELDRICGD
jgi:phosphohistidine phosphatase